jgi:predicted dehydrogenase
MLADDEVKLVVIAMRPEMQARLSIEALRAGKNVYCEKPLGETVEEALAVARAAREAARRVAVGFNRRFAPAYADLKPRLAGREGAPLMYYRIADHERGGRENTPRMIDELCHIYDILSWLADSEPRLVYATELSHHNDNVMTITFADGSVGTIISTGRASLENPKERLEVFWDHKAVFVEDFIEARYFHIPGAERIRRYAGRKDVHTPPALSRSFATPKGLDASLDAKKRFSDEWEKMEAGKRYDEKLTKIPVNYVMNKGWGLALDEMALATIEGRKPRNATASDGARANVVALAGVRSIKEGAPVRVDPSEWGA